MQMYLKRLQLPVYQWHLLGCKATNIIPVGFFHRLSLTRAVYFRREYIEFNLE